MFSQDACRFSVAVTIEDCDAPVIFIRGDVDNSAAPRLAARLASVIKTDPRRLILDLMDTTFMNARGLAVIAQAARQLGPDRPLVLRHPTPAIHRVLRVTGLDGVCEIQDNAKAGEDGRATSATPHGSLT